MCPASLAAEIAPEPLPPAGISVTDLPPELVRFIFTEWLPWGRDNVRRLARAQASECGAGKG